MQEIQIKFVFFIPLLLLGKSMYCLEFAKSKRGRSAFHLYIFCFAFITQLTLPLSLSLFLACCRFHSSFLYKCNLLFCFSPVHRTQCFWWMRCHSTASSNTHSTGRQNKQHERHVRRRKKRKIQLV